MFGLRRQFSKVSVAKNALNGINRVISKPNPSFRLFSSVLNEKGTAEELKYIKSQEDKRKNDLRANVERILQLEDSHRDKTVLYNLLGILSLEFF
jgi:hypothetical protein